MSTDLTRIMKSIGEQMLCESLVEEPYIWEIRLSGSVEGLGNNRGTTEEGPSLLDHYLIFHGPEK